MADQNRAYGPLTDARRALFLLSKFFGPRRHGRARALFVAGVQRSGTNMAMEVLEASREVDTVHERDPRGFENFMMRPEPAIVKLMDGLRRPVFAIKALHESERVTGLLTTFAPARAIWVYRNPDSVIGSLRRSWPTGRNQLEDIVADPARAGWRGAGMSAATLATLRAVHTPDLDQEAAQALFYVYRNQLLFDQGLDRDPRVLLVNYDHLTAAPESEVRRIAAFVGIVPTRRMIAHPRPVRPSRPVPLPAPIRALADAMHARLEAARLGAPS